jgi:hypothetical protein
MMIIGCDYHPSLQQIAWYGDQSQEGGERRPHDGVELLRFGFDVTCRLFLPVSMHILGRPTCDPTN